MKKFWDIALGIALILHIIVLNLISGARIAFSLPIIILGIILILYHFIKNKIKENEFLTKGFKVIKIFLCIGLIGFFGIETMIISYPKHNKEKADYVIVLGAGLTNRTNPSAILQGRLDASLKYIEGNDNVYIVLSGGQGVDEDLPESHAMSKYLQDRGVNKDRIIIEDESRNTSQNFKYSKVKIEEHSKKTLNDINVKIITTDSHAFRSSIIAKKTGYVNFDNYSSSTVWYLIPITYTREAFGIVKSVVFD